MAVKAPSHQVQRIVSLALDVAFYRTVYEDIGADGDALGHYLAEGWREGRDPAPWFSTRRYLAANPEVARAGTEPLHHFLVTGRETGRQAFASEHATRYFAARRRRGEASSWSAEGLIAPAGALPPPPRALAVAAVTPEDRAVVAAEFDAAYYLGMNPDVAQAGTDPLGHFLIAGWIEGRDPHPHFSVRDYLELYPDIVQAGINPFVHYLKAGRAEGRLPRQDLGFRYQILADLQPVEARTARARAATTEVHLGPAERLLAAFSRSRTGLRDLHVTFSHDDYTANLGGVQLCLQREDARIADLGRDHLHLYPVTPWPVVRAPGEPGALGVVWNGAPAGVFAPATVAEALSATAGSVRARKRTFAIHSMLGHAAGETIAILAAAGLKRGFFWLHDFASLCAGFHLLRNDVEDCAAPPADSPACGICVYGPWRARHIAEHARLFEALDLTVVSPSQPTLDLWKAASSYSAKAEVVLPHAQLVTRGAAPAAPGERPLRVGFPGLAAPHKGWPVFHALALRFAEDPRYEFHHFGLSRPQGALAAFHPVSADGDRPDAMRAAMAAAEIDVALVWPLCRETFSFTAYESVAAGAAVVTHPDTGNVAAFVAAGGHGLVLTDETALATAFETGDILRLARRERRPQLYDLEFGALTMDLIEPEDRA